MACTCTRRYLLFQRSYHFKFDTRFSSINRRICIEHQSQGDPIWDLWTMSGQLWANPKAFGSCAATCWEQLGTTKDRGHNCSKCGIELCTGDGSISVISFNMLWFNIFNGSFWVGDLCPGFCCVTALVLRAWSWYKKKCMSHHNFREIFWQAKVGSEEEILGSRNSNLEHVLVGWAVTQVIYSDFIVRGNLLPIWV